MCDHFSSTCTCAFTVVDTAGETLDAVLKVIEADGESATDHECLEEIYKILNKYFDYLDIRPEL